MKFLKDFFSVLTPEDPSKTKQNKNNDDDNNNKKHLFLLFLYQADLFASNWKEITNGISSHVLISGAKKLPLYSRSYFCPFLPALGCLA